MKKEFTREQRNRKYLNSVIDGHIEAVAHQLKNFADINCKNRKGQTALFLAMEKNRLPMVEYLLDRQINTEIKNLAGDTALQYAIKLENMDFVDVLLKNSAKVLGFTGRKDPLIMAIDRNSVAIIDCMAKHGVSLGAEDHRALRHAIINDKHDVLLALLSHGENEFLKRTLGKPAWNGFYGINDKRESHAMTLNMLVSYVEHDHLNANIETESETQGLSF